MRIELPNDVKNIIETLEKAGHDAYAVGGCVRDCALNKVPHDWDITTSADPMTVKGLFDRTFDTGLEHGTVTVLLNGVGYEVTTYRIDGIYEDGRHPKSVTFTGELHEDLKRRDFTINAMAYNDREGLVDIFGGMEDLKSGVIRAVGTPEERFSEDALRMLRALRFAAQLGFEIEENTRAAIVSLAPTLKKVSAERIQVELEKLICSDHPELMREVYECGLSAVFFPEWDVMMETEQNSKHHIYNVGEHTIEAMKHVRADRVMRLAMLLHDVGKPGTISTDEKGQNHFYGHMELGETMSKEILRRLRFDNDTIRVVSRLIRYHDDRPEVTKENVRRLMVRSGVDYFPQLLEVKRADVMGQSLYKREAKLGFLDQVEAFYNEILEEGQCVRLSELAVDGNDLIAIGVSQGKLIGRILNKLFEEVVDTPSKNEKEYLLKRA
ncbi:MAG: HD domain-containing protein, partial [Parasporobacterium sp.]|nr:HD domain-containing protein [Parasporobacterium sp.]